MMSRKRNNPYRVCYIAPARTGIVSGCNDVKRPDLVLPVLSLVSLFRLLQMAAELEAHGGHDLIGELGLAA